MSAFTDTNDHDSNPSNNRFSWPWPKFWFGMGVAVTSVLVFVNVARAFNEFDENIIDVITITIAGLLMTAVWFVAVLSTLGGRKWRRLPVVLISPLCALIVPAIAFASGISPRFLIERHRMEAVISTMAPTGNRYKEFHWAETGFAGSGETSQYIVYDETDALPIKIKEGLTHWPSDWTAVKDMGGHFFYVNEALVHN